MSTIGDTLQRKLEAVVDEASFVEFVAAMAADREDEVRKEAAKPSQPYGPGANRWENATIEAFLDSAAAWATDIRESPQYKAPSNPWRRCAEILYAGKHYE